MKTFTTEEIGWHVRRLCAIGSDDVDHLRSRKIIEYLMKLNRTAELCAAKAYDTAMKSAYRDVSSATAQGCISIIEGIATTVACYATVAEARAATDLKIQITDRISKKYITSSDTLTI